MSISEDSAILASLIVDWNYLCKRHNRSFPTKESLALFMESLARELANLARSAGPEKIGNKTYEKILRGGRINVIKGHVFCEEGYEHLLGSAWDRYEKHPVSSTTIELECEGCGRTNILKPEEINKKALMDICEIVLVEVHRKSPIDLFVFILDNEDCKEVMKMCKKYKKAAYIAGYDDVPVGMRTPEVCSGYIDLEKLRSANDKPNVVIGKQTSRDDILAVALEDYILRSLGKLTAPPVIHSDVLPVAPPAVHSAPPLFAPPAVHQPPTIPATKTVVTPGYCPIPESLKSEPKRSPFAIGVAVPMEFDTHRLHEKLENYGVKPADMKSGDDKFKPGSRFIRIYYNTHESAETAKALVWRVISCITKID